MNHTLYKIRRTKQFEKDYKKLSGSLKIRLKKKIRSLATAPYKKPLRNVMKGKYRIHVGSFVLVYEIKETEKKIILERFQHHDVVYKK